MAFLIAEARSVMTFWVGPGFDESVLLVQILAIGYGVNVLGGAASQTGAGVGRPEFDMRSTVLLSILNPILSVLLVRQFGAAGAAAGTSLAFVVATVYLLVTFHRNYVQELRPDDFPGHLPAADRGRRFCESGCGRVSSARAAAAAWETVRYLTPIKMAADFGVFAPVYIVLLVAFRQVTAIDWNNFLGLISFSSEFLRHPFRERVKIYR